MTRARDLGNGPHRAFGSALSREPIQLITERPIRPSFGGKGRCEQCGSRFFGCGHDEDENDG